MGGGAEEILPTAIHTKTSPAMVSAGQCPAQVPSTPVTGANRNRGSLDRNAAAGAVGRISRQSGQRVQRAYRGVRFAADAELRQQNSKADSACLCAETVTLRALASQERNASTLAPPQGCRVAQVVEEMKVPTQWT